MTKKQLQYQITHNILGYASLGFFDHDTDPAEWHKFVDDYFSRSGEIEGLKYSSELNRRLSSTAMLQTLDEVKKRIDRLFAEDKAA